LEQGRQQGAARELCLLEPFEREVEGQLGQSLVVRRFALEGLGEDGLNVLAKDQASQRLLLQEAGLAHLDGAGPALCSAVLETFLKGAQKLLVYRIHHKLFHFSHSDACFLSTQTGSWRTAASRSAGSPLVLSALPLPPSPSCAASCPAPPPLSPWHFPSLSRSRLSVLLN
jgi:hypothetical protein